MKTAVLGYGMVGVGVYEMLSSTPCLEEGPVFVRPGKEDVPYKTSDINAILNDPSIEAVAEAMGGIEQAGKYAEKALLSGKHFVTANKALVAARGPELARLAKQQNVGFLFSAACGGGVPFLHNLSLAVAGGDEIKSISGILNGSTNYMLDAMQRRGVSYGEIMKEAKGLGYLEADPSADVSGLDALRKIILACAVAYGKLPSEGLNCEGIENYTADDVLYTSKMGLRCRLMTRAGQNEDGSIYSYVEPALLASEHIGYGILTNYNWASYNAVKAGPISLIGQGAGRYPTASAVIRDLADIVNGRRTMMSPSTVRVKAENSARVHSYYVRVSKERKDEFSADTVDCAGDTAHIITRPISVSEMHSKIKKLRTAGNTAFFAAIGEEIC